MNKTNTNNEFTNLSLNTDSLDLYVMRRAILKFVDKNSPSLNGVLLDIGCGKMPYKDLILSYGKVTKYVGLDLEKSSTYDTTVADLHWDGIQIPTANASIDSIMATEFLEHHADTQAIIKEMYRVLRPGGVILFTVPFIWPLHEVPNDEYRFTPYSLNRFFSNAGFKSINLSATGGWHASLALMLGIWVKSALIRNYKRNILKRLIVPCIRFLLNHDLLPSFSSPNEFIMMPGIGGLVTK